MAQVSQGYRATITLADNGRKIITRSYELRSSTIDFAAALTAAAALIVDMEGASELEVLAYTVAEVFQEDTPVYPTSLVAQAEMHALINVGIEGIPLKTATLAIPGPKDSLFVGAVGFDAYDDVDGADTEVIAFMDNFKETGGTFSISDGEQIADSGSFKNGRRIHRRSRKG